MIRGSAEGGIPYENRTTLNGGQAALDLLTLRLAMSVLMKRGRVKMGGLSDTHTLARPQTLKRSEDDARR